MRGIVVSPPVSIHGEGFTVGNGYTGPMEGIRLDPQELRAWLLFWDRLDWPDSPIINFVLGPDEQFLMAQGVLQRTRYIPTASVYSGSQAFLRPHLEVLHQLERASPGNWSLATGSRSMQVMGEAQGTANRGFMVSLYGAIPVPKGDVPLEDVLRFRERRSAELARLRAEMTPFT